MKTILNILWVLLGGLILAIQWFLTGLLCCITIIGIPIGIQCFKLAGLSLWPFGKTISYSHFGAGSVLGNIIWILLFGWELALSHLMVGAFFCITIIGIPFGLQCFKLAQVSLFPFGVTFE